MDSVLKSGKWMKVEVDGVLKNVEQEKKGRVASVSGSGAL